ncbi:GTPase [Aquimarina litoralis]|uniref:GTPase n=1 Tax=Aquimarina litoralis TaxID=584605 RepID=UPI001C58CB26|nr:GTPase [Aquimarina litoralis]MBW1294292.1 GTPase [Aquimarina litoralis]
MKKIIFVYNAESDPWNKSLDFAHKILSPSTYSCSLCSLTHGNFSEKRIWKTFRETSPYVMVFKYKNEFLTRTKNHPNQEFHFPVVMVEKGDEYEVLISAEELGKMESVAELIEKLKLQII